MLIVVDKPVTDGPRVCVQNVDGDDGFRAIDINIPVFSDQPLGGAGATGFCVFTGI